MNVITTSRLNLRHWHSSDFEPVTEYFKDPVHTRFLGGTKNKEASWRLIARYVGHQQLMGYSYFAVEERETENFIGGCGLWNSDPWPEMELGYWLLPNGQGKGYATEAAQAVRDYAFNQLRVDTLVSYIAPGNMPSIKVAEKLGARLDKEIELLDFGPHKVYRYPAPGA